MSKAISSSNVSFDILKGSSDFLKHIINDISSCILLLDKDLMLHAFNDPLKNIFADKPNDHLLYHKCGDAIGCAYTVEEIKECGSTSKCSVCELRESALMAYVNRKDVYRGKIIREFYKTNTKKTLKYLQFSTRSFYFKSEYYIIVIINDITPLTE